jgi:hypothetical protein
MKKVQERYQARRYSPRVAPAAVGLKVNSLKLLDRSSRRWSFSRRASGIGC